MSKIKLTKEQKEYLKSIESKKKRKKIKRKFKSDNLFFRLFMFSNENTIHENHIDCRVLDGKNTPLKDFFIKYDYVSRMTDTTLSPEQLKSISEPKKTISNLESTCFSLKDLRDAFYKGRMKTAEQNENLKEYKVVYKYIDFNDFLKDL